MYYHPHNLIEQNFATIENHILKFADNLTAFYDAIVIDYPVKPSHIINEIDFNNLKMINKFIISNQRTIKTLDFKNIEEITESLTIRNCVISTIIFRREIKIKNVFNLANTMIASVDLSKVTIGPSSSKSAFPCVLFKDNQLLKNIIFNVLKTDQLIFNKLPLLEIIKFGMTDINTLLIDHELAGKKMKCFGKCNVNKEMRISTTSHEVTFFNEDDIIIKGPFSF